VWVNQENGTGILRRTASLKFEGTHRESRSGGGKKAKANQKGREGTLRRRMNDGVRFEMTPAFQNTDQTETGL